LCNPPARAGKGKPAVPRATDADAVPAGLIRRAGLGARADAAAAGGGH